MNNQFFALTLKGKPISAHATDRKAMVAVVKIILGVGAPLALAADAGLYYGIAAFLALLSHGRLEPDALTWAVFMGYVALLGLAMTTTHRVLRQP